MKVHRFRDLTIWKLGMEITRDIYTMTSNFPKSEMYGITSQMRRAAISIPSNIAEGFRRFSRKDFNRFLLISLGSCAELETQIEICHQLKYISKETYKVILEKIDHLGKVMTRFMTTPKS